MHDISKYSINFIYENTLHTISLYQANQGDKSQFSLGDRNYTFESDANAPQAVKNFFESLSGTQFGSDTELVAKLATIGASAVSLTKRTYDLVTERLLGKVTVDNREAKEQKKSVMQSLLGCSDREQVAHVLQSSRCSCQMLFDIADDLDKEAPAIAKMVRTLSRPFDLEKTFQKICSHVQNHYFDEELGKKYAEALGARLESYQGIFERDAFTAKITQDLREISHDGHFELLAALPPRNDVDTTFHFKQFEDRTCALEIVAFANPHNPDALEAAKSSMQALREKNPEAVVLDLRKNHGGSPYMAAYIASHFLPADISLTNFRYRHEPQGKERDTFPVEPTKTLSLDELPEERRMPDVPLYVLTSHETFSAAEDLVCHLKEQGRATVIGEKTGGGGNPAKLFDVEAGFFLAVPIGEVSVPYGKTGKEQALNPISMSQET